MLEFLNQFSGAFLVLFTFIVTITTVVYALITGKMFSETKKMREAQTEPHVFINLQTSEAWISLLDLVIQNIGSGPAYNLKFKVNPDIELRTKRPLSELNLIKYGIKYLPPNQKISFFIGNLIEDSKREDKTVLEVTTSYENRKGDKFEESFILDFSEFLGLLQVGELPLKKVAKDLEKIQRDIHSVLFSSYPRMKVVTYTKKDMEEEHLKILDEERKAEENKK